MFESQAQNRVHVETASISLRRRSLRYRGAAFKENIVDFKYKGISEDKINEIQVKYMPKFEIPVLDIDVMKKYAIQIRNSIDEFVKSDLHNKDIYIICEMAKLYLDSLKQEKCCGTCAWYAEFEGVCCCGDSKFRDDFRCLDDTCDCWTSREDNNDK